MQKATTTIPVPLLRWMRASLGELDPVEFMLGDHVRLTGRSKSPINPNHDDIVRTRPLPLSEPITHSRFVLQASDLDSLIAASDSEDVTVRFEVDGQAVRLTASDPGPCPWGEVTITGTVLCGEPTTAPPPFRGPACRYDLVLIDRTSVGPFDPPEIIQVLETVEVGRDLVGLELAHALAPLVRAAAPRLLGEWTIVEGRKPIADDLLELVRELGRLS